MLMVIHWIKSIQDKRFLCFRMVYKGQSLLSYLKINLGLKGRHIACDINITVNKGIFLFLGSEFGRYNGMKILLGMSLHWLN